MKTTIIFFLCIFWIRAAHSQLTYEECAKAICNAMDYNNPIVRDVAVQLAKQFPGEFSIGQLCQIYDYMRGNWGYVNDPKGSEYFANASESIQIMGGDCDDFAIALSSLLTAIGGSSRVVVVPGHAFAEVYLTRDESKLESYLKDINNYYSNIFNWNPVNSIWYHRDADGRIWLNLDWWSEYPGGPFYNNDPDAEHLVVYSNCTWRVARLNGE